MSEDNRNFVERSESLTQLSMGRSATPDEIVKEFAKQGSARRVSIIDQLDSDLASDEPLSLGTNEFRRVQKMRSHRRAFGNVHEALRRAGR